MCAYVIYLIQVSNISLHCSNLITIRHIVCGHHILVQHSTKYDLNRKSHMFNTRYHYPTKFQQTTPTLVPEWKTQREVLETGI